MSHLQEQVTDEVPRVDPANVWQWCKSAIDSLADAGLIVNDSDLECGEIVGYYGKAAGVRRDMEFRVTPLEETNNVSH